VVKADLDGKLTSDGDGLRSRGSVCLGALSEGGGLWAVRSVDLDLGISLVKETRSGKRHTCETLKIRLEIETPRKTLDREGRCSRVNLHQW